MSFPLEFCPQRVKRYSFPIFFVPYWETQLP